MSFDGGSDVGRTWRATGGRRPPVTDDGGREAAGLILVAGTVAVVAASVIAAGVGAGTLWVFEFLAATGLLIGLGVAFGAFDRGGFLRRRGRRRPGAPSASPELAAAVLERIEALDRVEHRRLELGDPWPMVVVGPTGVSVIAIAERVAAPDVARLEEVVVVATGVVRSLALSRRVDVRGLLVVPDGETVLMMSARVHSVVASDLEAVIARGALVPMATVAELFARLSGALAPDLSADAV